jgi:hypothetical protein
MATTSRLQGEVFDDTASWASTNCLGSWSIQARIGFKKNYRDTVTKALHPVATIFTFLHNLHVSEIISLYNQNMSGVDLLNQLISYYRICINASGHFMDFAVTTS